MRSRKDREKLAHDITSFCNERQCEAKIIVMETSSIAHTIVSIDTGALKDRDQFYSVFMINYGSINKTAIGQGASEVQCTYTLAYQPYR